MVKNILYKNGLLNGVDLQEKLAENDSFIGNICEVCFVTKIGKLKNIFVKVHFSAGF